MKGDPSSNVSTAHDIRYSLARNDKDIRRAD
jgi:hypothetical protein